LVVHWAPEKVQNHYGQFSVKTPTPVHPLLKVGKPLVGFLVYSMYLNEKKTQKWQEKFCEYGPVSAQSDACFLVQNWSFFNIFTLHLQKHIRKT
jgi:hypothetical protein